MGDESGNFTICVLIFHIDIFSIWSDRASNLLSVCFRPCVHRGASVHILRWYRGMTIKNISSFNLFAQLEFVIMCEIVIGNEINSCCPWNIDLEAVFMRWSRVGFDESDPCSNDFQLMVSCSCTSCIRLIENGP